MKQLITLVIVAVACKSTTPSDPTTGSAVKAAASPIDAPTPPTPPIPSISPEARARAFLDKQIATVTGHDGGRPEFLATFDKAAIIAVPGKVPVSVDEIDMIGIGSGPGGFDNTDPTITKLVAEGTPDAVWFYADVATTIAARTPKEKPAHETTRVVELLLGSAGWKAVAGSFSRSKTPAPLGYNVEIAGANTADGSLTKLAGSPTTLATKLAPNAIVIGPTTEQFALRADAAKALAGWKLEPLKLFERSKEVTAPTIAYAQGNFDHAETDPQYTDRFVALVIAVPAADKSWSVVLAQYLVR